MSDRERYRRELAALAPEALTAYLGAHSGLPGPRANLTLVQAAADVMDEASIQRLAASDDEYLALCGAVGLGRLLTSAVSGDPVREEQLRQLAADPRWRVREGVAMALQRIGDAEPARFWATAAEWLTVAAERRPDGGAGRGEPESGLYLARAVVAAVAEPRHVKEAADARTAQRLLDTATALLRSVLPGERRSDAFRVLRQALGYGWSVVIPGSPESGFDALDRWAALDDADIRWMLRQNTTKARLSRADPTRFQRLRSRVSGD